MNREGVTEDEDEERLSVLSAVEDTQLTTRGTLPRRSPLTRGFSQEPSVCHTDHTQTTDHLYVHITCSAASRKQMKVL